MNSVIGCAPPVLILTRAEIAALMDIGGYIEAVEDGFRADATGRALAPPPMHIPSRAGGFHVKAASLNAARSYVAVKVNGNFPSNPANNALPTIQGAILLCDGDNGCPLAIMDSIEVTAKRTAAATALAARYLARPDSAAVAICGCGTQGRAQLIALHQVLKLRLVYAWDSAPIAAVAYAAEMSTLLGLEARAVVELSLATLPSDVIVTATTAREPFLGLDEVSAGTFIAAVGADNPEKSELQPALMARSKVVADSLEQCMVMGDLHHAIASGAMRRDDVHAELGDLITERKSTRISRDEVIIFDSTGTALQDVAAAARLYERARERGIGTLCCLDGLT
jgi:ornithine cyclodeaminase/alanine dehydrogenase-like protein (mu-crystallin family)